jgi:hypothetical protein
MTWQSRGGIPQKCHANLRPLYPHTRPSCTGLPLDAAAVAVQGGHRLTMPLHDDGDMKRILSLVLYTARSCLSLTEFRFHLTNPRERGVHENTTEKAF